MFTLAKLNDPFRRLLNKVSTTYAAAQALLLLAQQAAADAAASAEAATMTLPIDAIILDEETGAVGFVAKPGEFRLFQQRFSSQGNQLAALSASVEGLGGEVALKASRDSFEGATAVARLRAPVGMTPVEAATATGLVLPLDDGLGSPAKAGDVFAVETAGGLATCVVAATVGPDDVDVPIQPRPLAAPAGAAVYEPSRKARARISARFDLLEQSVSGDVIGTATPLIGRLAANVVAGEGLTELGLDEVLFAPFDGETVRIAGPDGPISAVVAEDLESTDGPATLVIEPTDLPNLVEGAEVRISEQTLGSLIRQTARGRSTVISRADLDPAKGAVVLCTLAAAVDDAAATEIAVTPMVRDEDLVAPRLLVIRDAETDDLTEVIVDEDVAVGDELMSLFEVAITASAGSEVVQPASSAYAQTLEAAAEFSRRIASETSDGVSFTVFQQTTEEIRAIAENGDFRSIWEVNPQDIIVKGGRSVRISAGGYVKIGDISFSLGGFYSSRFLGIESTDGVKVLSTVGTVQISAPVGGVTITGPLALNRVPTVNGSGLALAENIPNITGYSGARTVMDDNGEYKTWTFKDGLLKKVTTS